jgi:diguanylate cyclase (GGDEF)-like protein/hemerythrin-like metal-binding protein
MLDVDHFKNYNDTYGHIRGDECLRQISNVIKACASRPADLAARYGGEEFVCILPETGIGGARAIAEKIRSGIEALAIPHKASSVANHVTASLGVATAFCNNENSASSLIAEADKLLYLAKSKGRNRLETSAASQYNEAESHFIKLVWHDAYCSGNPLIDAQHKQLFHAADQLLDAILADHTHDEVSGLIAHLLVDVTQHFHDEIQILESLGYTNLLKHTKEHAALVSKALSLKKELDERTLSVGDVFQFLAYDVITRHMLHSDREFFPLTQAAFATPKT